MKTLEEIALQPTGFDSRQNYIGETEFDGVLVVMGRNRDSDILTESNWACALKELGGESDTVIIHRFGHWACGWIEYLCVTEAKRTQAEGIQERIENYPVLDEDDFSRREQKEADRVWEDCYNTSERVEYIRKNESQFEFRDYSDMRRCIRGEYFSGYASELIG